MLRKIIRLKKNISGFLLLAAAALLVIGSMVMLLASHMVSVDSFVSNNENETVEALYIATAGLQKATYALTTDNLSDQVDCLDITNNLEFTNVSFGDGYFTVLGAEVTNNSAQTTTSISSDATVIPISNLSSYGNLGQATIGNEIIQYAGISNSAATCAAHEPCLVNVKRGVNGSSAAMHATGETIVQEHCHLLSTGSIPDANHPKGQRVLSQDVYLAATDNSSAGWLAGKVIGSGNSKYENILRLNNNIEWLQLPADNDLPNLDLYGAFALNANNAWLVGNKNSGRTTIFYWNGDNWSRADTSGTPNRRLRAIHCYAQDNCWAVGDNKVFVHWNGSTWSNGNVSSNVPSKRINSVYCSAADQCWAVGLNHGGQSLIAYWNGTQWSLQSLLINNNDDEDDDDDEDEEDDDEDDDNQYLVNQELFDVTCVNTNDCWAVGRSRTFIHWDGSRWGLGDKSSNVPNKHIRSVSCIASDNCWAVGNRSGDALVTHWDGSQWSRITLNSRWREII